MDSIAARNFRFLGIFRPGGEVGWAETLRFGGSPPGGEAGARREHFQPETALEKYAATNMLEMVRGTWDSPCYRQLR